MLFWKDLTKSLTDWGFIVNPYDRCVMNKVIDGKQCTVLWHVDDIKISHVSENVITSMIEYLSEKYGWKHLSLSQGGKFIVIWE